MAAASSAPFFGMREEDHNQMIKQQSASSPSSPTAPPAQSAAAPVKKRRNLPGTPNPDAEVIALSPRTLMATNRFVCEVCNKGFQREQNLQLHRRGHNLPWKLKQKSPSDAARRKVYLCPEPSCVHHEPSRALGDLTGIKKHFCRKHGEKKWKCDKCSKRYAVQSDWKAHAKTCGTREYRCDCGTLFSRRDSFITHRAFCDALAQESVRLPPGLASLGSHLYGGSMGLGLSQVSPQISSLHDQVHHASAADLLRLGATGSGSSQFDHLLPPSFRPPSSPFFLGTGGPDQDFVSTQSTHHPLLQTKPFSTGLMQLPGLQSNAAANLFNLSFFSSGSGEQAATLFSTSLMNEHSGGLSSLYGTSMHENHGPVGLPHMSATALLQKAAQIGATTSGGGGGSGALLRGLRSSSSTLAAKNEAHIHDLMNSLANGYGGLGGSMGGSDGLTRDFLGLGSMVRMSQREHHHHGIDFGSMEPELKSTISGAQTFPGGSMQ